MATCVRCGQPASDVSLGTISFCADCRAQAASTLVNAQQVLRPATVPPRPRLPLTEILIGVNVLVFVVMVARGVSPFFPRGQLLDWGANYGPLSLGGQPWRMLTSNYVHIGILHLGLNMWCLWNLGKVAEHMFGRLTYFATYTVCGIAGSLATLWWDPTTPGAGASGAIFGLAGALITAIYLGKLPYPRSTLRSLGRSLLSFAGYNLLIGHFIPIIDNSAHLGGLVMGLLLGASLAPWLTETARIRRNAERILFTAAVLLLLGAFSYVRKTSGYVVQLVKAQSALTSADPAKAVQELEALARSQPNDPGVLRVLGISYLQAKDYAKAEATFLRLTELLPDDLSAKYQLGVVYGASDRFEQSRQVFAELTQRDPSDDEYWLLLGSSLKELHRPEEADKALRQAIHLNPQNYQAYRDLGWVQFDLKRSDAALDAFQHAVQIEPKDADSQLGLSRAYAAKGMEKESAEASRRYNGLHAEEAPAPNSKH
jgi:rhomboid protease GluP